MPLEWQRKSNNIPETYYRVAAHPFQDGECRAQALDVFVYVADETDVHGILAGALWYHGPGPFMRTVCSLFFIRNVRYFSK